MFSNLHTLDYESVELHFSGPRLLSREIRLPLLRAFLVACAPHPNLDFTISSFPNGRRQIWFQVVGGKDTLKMSYKVSSMPTFPKHSGIFWFCGSLWAAGLAFQKSAFSPLFHPVWSWVPRPRRSMAWHCSRVVVWSAVPTAGGPSGHGSARLLQMATTHPVLVTVGWSLLTEKLPTHRKT